MNLPEWFSASAGRTVFSGQTLIFEVHQNWNARVWAGRSGQGEFRSASGIQNAQVKLPNVPCGNFGLQNFWFWFLVFWFFGFWSAEETLILNFPANRCPEFESVCFLRFASSRRVHLSSKKSCWMTFSETLILYDVTSLSLRSLGRCVGP